MFEIYKNKKVLITGHTGFKGTWLTSLLNVLEADLIGYSLAPNTEPSHYNIINSEIKTNIGDIRDTENLKNCILKSCPEIIFHLAAQPLVRESYKDPKTTYETNVIGTLNLLDVIKYCPSVKAVVIITTDKVYENKEWVHPYRETDELGGYDIYSSSKACAEILVKSYQKSFFNIADFNIKHQTLIATVRAGNVIGGGDWSNDRLVPDIIKAASRGETTKIRNPNSIRPWQHVLDCLFGYLMVGEQLLNGKVDYADAWNFAPYAFESLTVKEVACIAKKIWTDIEIEFEKPLDEYHEAGVLKLDNTKAISLLGWKPIWSTETAIIKTVEWYKTYYINNQVLTVPHIKEYLLANGIY